MTKSISNTNDIKSELIQFGQPRRYLVNINSKLMNQLFTDCVIIGAGVAGLRAAIEVSKDKHVIIVCKGTLEESNTWKAQGGIASVLEKNDTFESHINDTLNTGCGLSDKEIDDIQKQKKDDGEDSENTMHNSLLKTI